MRKLAEQITTCQMLLSNMEVLQENRQRFSFALTVHPQRHFPLGEFVRAKRKTNFGNVIGQRKKSPRKS